jgi:hypothetical protein
MKYEFYLAVAQAGDVKDFLWPYLGAWRRVVWRRMLVHRRLGIPLSTSVRVIFEDMLRHGRIVQL